MIYAIQEPLIINNKKCGYLIKIGIALNVPKRFKNIQSMTANELILLGVMKGYRSEELAIFKKFEKQKAYHVYPNRYNSKNEWFIDCKEIRQFIHKNMTLDKKWVTRNETRDTYRKKKKEG